MDEEQEPRRSARETKGQKKGWDMNSSLGSSPSRDESPKSTSASKSGTKEKGGTPKTPSKLKYSERGRANTQANMGALKAKSTKVNKIRASTSVRAVQKQPELDILNDAILDGENGGIASEHMKRLKFPQPDQWIDSTNIMEAPDRYALEPGKYNPPHGSLDRFIAEYEKKLQDQRDALDRGEGHTISPPPPHEFQAPRDPFEYGNGQSTLGSVRLPSPGQQLPEQNMLQNQRPHGVGAGAWGGSFSWRAYGQPDIELDGLQISDSDGEGAEDQRISASGHHLGQSSLQVGRFQMTPAQRHIYERLGRRPSTPGHVATLMENLKKVTPAMVTPEIVPPTAANLERSKLESKWRLERAIALSSDETYQRRLAAFYNLSRNRLASENLQWEDPVTQPDYPPNTFDDLANPPPPRQQPQRRRQSDPTISAWINHRWHMDETWQPLASKADAAAAKGRSNSEPSGDGRSQGAVTETQARVSLDRGLQPAQAGETTITAPDLGSAIQSLSQTSPRMTSDSRVNRLNNCKETSSVAPDGQTLETAQQARAETIRLESSGSPLEPAALPLVSAPNSDLANELNLEQALVSRPSDLSNIEQTSTAASAERTTVAVQGTGDAPKPATDKLTSANHNMTVMMFTLPKGPSVEELVAASPFSFILRMVSKVGEGAAVDRRVAASSFQRQMMDLRSVGFRAAHLGFGNTGTQQQLVRSSLLRGSGQEVVGEDEGFYSPPPIGTSAARLHRSFTLLGTLLPLPVSTTRSLCQRSLGQTSNSIELNLDVENGPNTLLPLVAKPEARRNYLSTHQLRDPLLLDQHCAARFDTLEGKANVREDKVGHRNLGAKGKVERYNCMTGKAETGSFTTEVGCDVDLEKALSSADAVFWEGERLEAECKMVGRHTAKENVNVNVEAPAAGNNEESKIEREDGSEEVAEKEESSPNERLSPWVYRSMAMLRRKIPALEIEMEEAEEEGEGVT